jgi:hypothetical protein
MAPEESQAGHAWLSRRHDCLLGPDDRRASKVVVSFIREEGAEPELRRWLSETGDVRADETIFAEIAVYLRQHSVHSVAMVDRIIGCPHEEGIDYPMDTACPRCPYWKGRDRWTGQLDSSDSHS